MNRDRAKEYLKSHATDYLTPDKSRKGYVCPICGSGSGKKGTGITSKDGGEHFSCWTGCFTNADIIDILGMKAGKTDYLDKLEAACNEAGIELDGSSGGEPRSNRPTVAPKPKPAPEPEIDYTEYYKTCHARISETDYAQKRGLSREICDRFNLGYDPAWQSPKALREGKHPPYTPRLIIPTSEYSYLARDTRKEVPQGAEDFVKMREGKVHIFNLDALKDESQPIIIVEGEIDALSIIEVGGNALGLGGTSNVDKLLGILEENKPRQHIIIALDNDEAGEKNAKKLEAGLKKLGIISYRRDLCEGITREDGSKTKDANEALQRDREGFTAAVEAVKKSEETEKEKYLKTSSLANLQSFLDGVTASANTPCIKTRFSKLDAALDGGLYEGLYTIGAITSAGKTSLMLQICDQIAEAGTDVLIFSLEMARTELMAKTISRHTFIEAHKLYPDPKDAQKANGLAKTERGITDGRRYRNYSPEETGLIRAAVRAYERYAENVFISEGVGDITASKIRETVDRHIRITGRKPVVLVDYLQILAPADVRATDKQNTDKAVLELKRISRDYKTTVIAISSLNRMSYNDEIKLSAFKESGAIEYSADCLLGYQLKGAGTEGFNSEEAKKKDPRTMELIILKNRHGEVGERITFSYYPKFNYFEEI